jgi:hypothetical protein
VAARASWWNCRSDRAAWSDRRWSALAPFDPVGQLSGFGQIFDLPGFFGFYYPTESTHSHKWGMVERRATAHNSFRCCHYITTIEPANTTRHEKRLNQVSQRRPFKDFQKPPQGGFFLLRREPSKALRESAVG